MKAFRLLQRKGAKIGERKTKHMTDNGGPTEHVQTNARPRCLLLRIRSIQSKTTFLPHRASYRCNRDVSSETILLIPNAAKRSQSKEGVRACYMRWRDRPGCYFSFRSSARSTAVSTKQKERGQPKHISILRRRAGRQWRRQWRRGGGDKKKKKNTSIVGGKKKTGERKKKKKNSNKNKNKSVPHEVYKNTVSKNQNSKRGKILWRT